MTSQERVRAAIARELPDRVPVFDQPWPETIERWHCEGLPRDQEVGRYFDFDIVQMSADLSPRLPYELLDETDDYLIERTTYGTIWKRLRKFPSILQTLEHPINNKSDWLRIRDRLQADPDRVNWPVARQIYESARAQGKYLAFVGFAGNSQIEGLLGFELSLCTMLEDPEWYKDMVEVLSNLFRDTVLLMHDEGLRFDAVWYPNDMGYRNGPTFSPSLYASLQAPSDKRRNAVFHEAGMQTILHTDGDIRSLIPAIIEAGFDCLQPLEVKAGMDVRELKREYGDRLALFGGIDARLMSDPDFSRIEEEIRGKFSIAKTGGGYLYHSDHSVPVNVSFEQFCHVIQCARKYGQYD